MHSIYQRRKYIETTTDIHFNEDDPEGNGQYYDYIPKWESGLKTMYLLGIGEFGDLLGKFDEVGWVIFIAATFIMIIVMMNLLVGVISNAIMVIDENRYSN
jgi:hypothetical protein